MKDQTKKDDVENIFITRTNTMQDKGHEQLLKDLESLLDEAKSFEFHDFKNQKYALPKATLVERLDGLRANIISGKYDN